ncbi:MULTISPECIES: hypothetical protein [Myroides]|uniref:Carboxypeptidase-like regulatory domain-containing protein n=1 Tax=Myroides albus TaxID=2562892 RepID=A0A6I3LEZ6_9FLAO|nr:MULTISPECIES: hypothetical protein [Myroides]MTG98039.1 hypothetical protein [Myroides albus]MVX35272.1 hypothetical protein [Myroides sp. LoEW2-1]UVD80779.1 hypothetical protein NWE55_05915 [Myroides albus]
MRFFLAFLLCLGCLYSFGQERKFLNGKIVSRSKNLEGVYISNLNSGVEVFSEKGGYFNLAAKENDTIMFSSPIFMGYQHIVDKIDLERDIMLIPLDKNDFYTQLDEIVIYKISAESLGLVPKGTKILTPAQSKLYTATSGGGLIPVSAIVNWISGRTKMLKKAYEYEKLDSRKNRLINYFSEEALMRDYSIPKDYVEGFALYAANDDQVESLLTGGGFEKEKVQARLGELALDFLELIGKKDEDKLQ